MKLHYELAVVIRDKHGEVFSNVVLLLGGFHQAQNYVKARSSGTPVQKIFL